MTPDNFVRYYLVVTAKQLKLLIYIRNRITHFGKAPTFSEMKRIMEVTSNQTIGDWLVILEREGYILRDKGRLRGITVTEMGLGFDENIRLQKEEAIRTALPLFSNSTTSALVFNRSSTFIGNNIKIEAKNDVPIWEGGEKNGSS